MSEQLNSYLSSFIRDYATEFDAAWATGDFKRPFGALVRQNIANMIQDKVDGDIYRVKGSVGAGRWTDVPWIAVFDKRITTSAQRGVYIVYLLNKDTKELFLTLNQGATDVAQGGDGTGKLSFTGIAKTSSDRTEKRLKDRAALIRTKIGTFNGLAYDPIKTGSAMYDAGSIYYVRYTLTTLPKDEKLIEDLTMMIQAYQAYYDMEYNTNSSKVASTDNKEEREVEMNNSVKQTLLEVESYISAKGFKYDLKLIENFYLSLKAKPFVILAGISGTGKTKLVKLYAEAIGANYKLVSVRPDWSDSSDLFGHTNLRGEFIPGAITDYVKEACENLEEPYFLCLDEMNLARVEYYFSDFLSLIETRKWENESIVTEPINLDDVAKKVYGELYIPDNLYFVGTVNMDETTYPFSKKVLDRANTIEFSDVELLPVFDFEMEEVLPSPQENKFIKSKYITLLTDISEDQHSLVTKVCTELEAINDILAEANTHVGYRVRDEIVFYMLNNDEAKLLSYEEALDFEIMQKILPRIQGSSMSVRDLLIELFKKFAGDYSAFSKDATWKQMKDYLNNTQNNLKYPRSAEKICYMMRRFEEDGFTSYWL